MTDSERREKLIQEYSDATNARDAIARERIGEMKQLAKRFAKEDERAVRVLNRMVDSGDRLGLYAFQVSEAFEVEDIGEMFNDYIDQIRGDVHSIKELRDEACDAENNEDDDEDDGSEEEE